MRTAWLTLLGASCLAVNAMAATVGFTVSNLGGGTFQYNYTVSGYSFNAGDTLDIAFNAAVMAGLGGPYASLVSGQAVDSVCTSPNSCTAGTNWSLQLFQVNTPPGGNGDYFATAQKNSPSLAGPFTVKFTLPAGGTTGAQDFTIFDPNFNPIQTGVTTPGGGPSVPEPTTASLTLVATSMGLISFYIRRRALKKT